MTGPGAVSAWGNGGGEAHPRAGGVSFRAALAWALLAEDAELAAALSDVMAPADQADAAALAASCRAPDPDPRCE